MAFQPSNGNSSRPPDRRLPFGGNVKTSTQSRTAPPRPRRVLAHHLILTGYGHWLPNDPRGSGSVELDQEKLADLGPIHYGRKRVQPPRKELREFYRQANELLEFRPFWFDHAKRQALADAFSQVIERRYTVWACAICSNHAHFCIRAHRDSYEVMWQLLTDAGRKALRNFGDVDPDHPVWTRAPYEIFLFTPDQIYDRVGYINANPIKEGLAPQAWPFVHPYNGWPNQSSQ
jgi:REP element-mobilizing transposase RayT